MPDDYGTAFTRPALEQLGQLLGFPAGRLAASQGGNLPVRSLSKVSNRSTPKTGKPGKSKATKPKTAAQKDSPTRRLVRIAA
jgi:hypothetical protein